jgi:hypothetical protein
MENLICLDILRINKYLYKVKRNIMSNLNYLFLYLVLVIKLIINYPVSPSLSLSQVIINTRQENKIKMNVALKIGYEKERVRACSPVLWVRARARKRQRAIRQRKVLKET